MNANSSRKAPPILENTEHPLRIGGFVPLSTTDYPGELAAVVFLQGCPWRCAYCHNPHLIAPDGPVTHAWSDILIWLERRRGLLDAVLFSGGEPTLQQGLADAMRAVRALGFKVGLHTSGAYPKQLRAVLPFCHWVGMDFKASYAQYDALTGVPGSAQRVRDSLAALVMSGVAHECRTTVHQKLHTLQELQVMAQEVLLAGAECYVLQPFRAEGCRDVALIEAADQLATAMLLKRTAKLSPGVLTRSV